MEGQRWQFGDPERPRDNVAFGVATERKRSVEVVGPAFGQPSTLGHFAHQRERSAAGDGVNTQPVAGIVAVHHVEAGADAEVRAKQRQGLVFRTVHAVHVNRAASHLFAVHDGTVSGFAGDGAGGAASRLLGVG